MHKVVVVHAASGNIGSVLKKLSRIGCPAEVATDHSGLGHADRIILPGVGHFGIMVKNLKNSGLWEALGEAVIVRKVPVLGICLGMQIMAERSEEGDEAGLGWISGEVVRFRVGNPYRRKIPHMGWNSVTPGKDSHLFRDVDLTQGFYFVHSYHIHCTNPSDILSTTEYDYPFTSAVQKDHISGVQFHPEKSHDQGETLLKNFINH